MCYMGVLVCCEGLLKFGKVVWIEGLHCIWYFKLGSAAVESVRILRMCDLMEDIGM